MEPPRLRFQLKVNARPWLAHTVLWSFCLTLLIGCGSGDEEPAPAATEAPPQLRPSSPPKSTKKVAAKKTPRDKDSRNNKRKPRKPPGIPIKPLEEDQFVVIGNRDQFELAAEPYPIGEKMVATAVSIDSSHVDVRPGSKPKKPSVAGDFKLPEGFTPIPEAGYSENGWPLRILCRADEAVMALVPAGVSIRGSNEGPENARPEHRVQLEPFYMDVHEVTHAQYERFRRGMQGTKTRIPAELEPVDDPQFPAVGVRWGEALLYARWAGKALPTEAEWEKAARGREGTYVYPWGNGKPIWHRPRHPGQIDRIGSFRGDISPFGIMDLAGNAREWCQEWYSDQAYELALKRSESMILDDPSGPTAAVGSKDRTVRVVKGGEEGWEAWRRNGVPMGTRSPNVGFRCVLRFHQIAGAEEDAEAKPKRKQGGF